MKSHVWESKPENKAMGPLKGWSCDACKAFVFSQTKPEVHGDKVFVNFREDEMYSGDVLANCDDELARKVHDS